MGRMNNIVSQAFWMNAKMGNIKGKDNMKTIQELLQQDRVYGGELARIFQTLLDVTGQTVYIKLFPIIG